MACTIRFQFRIILSLWNEIIHHNVCCLQTHNIGHIFIGYATLGIFVLLHVVVSLEIALAI